MEEAAALRLLRLPLLDDATGDASRGRGRVSSWSSSTTGAKQHCAQGSKHTSYSQRQCQSVPSSLQA
jgi:hypothetical protein